jgi:radical SAM-linked protein
MMLRVRYSKLGKVRFISHRDGARLWERALRKVAFPVAYTEGFTPRPKLSFGMALPTGAESTAEYIDIDLVEGVSVDGNDQDVVDRLSAALPVGMDVQVIAERNASDNKKLPSLQDEVTSTTWEMTGPGIEPELLEPAAQCLLAADELIVERERKGRCRLDDVRPLIRHLGPDQSGTRFVAELATIGRALRPSELAATAFPGIEITDLRVLRTHQWIENDSGRSEVLSLPVAVDALDRGLSA